MIRDDAVRLLGLRLNNRKGIEARILAEMDAVQEQILEENSWLPWFLESELAQAATTPGERRVSLPSDFLQEIEESHLWIVGDDGSRQRLLKGSYDRLQAQLPGEGRPSRFCISGEYFHLFPTPNEIWTLEMRYYAKDARMSADNVETKWLKYAGDLVIACVGEVMASKHYQNAALAAEFAKDKSAAWDRLLMKHTALQEINQSRSMNGEVE